MKYAVLYTDEDHRLMGSNGDLFRRFLYGFLEREGLRAGEARALQWGDIDLVHGTIRLDENKADHPRDWQLGPGVHQALIVWRQRAGDVAPTDLVFADAGVPIGDDHAAELLRNDLLAAGVDRHALHHDGTNWGDFELRSFRRGFVTRSFALGKSDSWVRRRTGHTSEEIRRYDQDSEELRRIDPDDWVPLVFAIPELSPLDAIGRALSALCTAVTPPRPTDDEEDIVSHFAALRASNPLHGMSEALKEALARASVLPEPPHGDPHCPGIAPEMVGAAGFAKPLLKGGVSRTIRKNHGESAESM